MSIIDSRESKLPQSHTITGIPTSFFKVSFWFPKWRSLKPQKGSLMDPNEATTWRSSHPLRLTAKWGNPVQREWHSPERSQRNNQSSADINKVNFAFNKIYKKKTTQTPDTACPAVACHQKITNQSNLYDVTTTIPSGPLDWNIYLQKYH